MSHRPPTVLQCYIATAAMALQHLWEVTTSSPVCTDVFVITPLRYIADTTSGLARNVNWGASSSFPVPFFFSLLSFSSLPSPFAFSPLRFFNVFPFFPFYPLFPPLFSFKSKTLKIQLRGLGKLPQRCLGRFLNRNLIWCIIAFLYVYATPQHGNKSCNRCWTSLKLSLQTDAGLRFATNILAVM